jgi:hypothetical protein
MVDPVETGSTMLHQLLIAAEERAMSPFLWFRPLQRRRPVYRPTRVRPLLEALEDRLAPATFVVNNINDSGTGSLRQAILNANATAAADTITFNIPGANPHIIQPLSPLPKITAPLAIKGASQPGPFFGAPLIILVGTSAGSASQGLLLTASNCSVDALSIVGFGQYGIDIQGGRGNVVNRCEIGVTPSGAAFGNGAGGVLLSNGATGNRIGGSHPGNVISGNGGFGVALFGAGTTGNVVSFNLIGTTANGVGALGNGIAGVALGGKASVNSVSTNIISGNGIYGVMLQDAGTRRNTVAGNLIGLNTFGNAVPNGFGVYIGLGASANVIGGVDGENVISGNGADGVLISGAGTSGNVIQSNFVGVGSDGSENRANGVNGIAIQDGASGESVLSNVVGFQSGAGVLLDGVASNLLKLNSIGISTSGGNAGNVGPGILVKDGSAKNVILANDIGNNNGTSTFEGGVQLEGVGTTGNLIQSNTIGLSLKANGAAAGNAYGVLIEGGASGNTVGGPPASLRNVISANSQYQVGIVNAGTSGNVVQSNFLGTNVLGTAAGPSQSLGGVNIENAPNNLIGGIKAGNVVSDNNIGIHIVGSTSSGNVVEGNFIGTNAAGTAAISNQFGIYIEATFNQIGGTMAGAGNIISGNRSLGVDVAGANTYGNVVQGNRIGVGATGRSLPNGAGIEIEAGAADNLIGGTTAPAGNLIADNLSEGVIVGFKTADTTTVGNAILGNRIFGNGALGIDLAGDGVTANHSGFTPGPNDLQNFPVLSQARLVGADVVVRGTLNSQANTTFRIEFFASAAADSSGHGQGELYLGYTTVTTDSSGNASFAVALPFSGAPGKVISATATAVTGGNTAASLAFGDTSEFSADLTAF